MCTLEKIKLDFFMCFERLRAASAIVFPEWLNNLLEHAGEQSLSSSTSTLSSEDAAEDVGSVEPCMFEPLADSSSTDELPSSADFDEHSEHVVVSSSVQKQKLLTAVHGMSVGV